MNWKGWKREVRRMLAFLRGDFHLAEGLEERPAFPPVEWITRSSEDESRATYALEATLRSFQDADASMRSLQSKAQSLLTIVLALFPLALAVTILVVPSTDGSWAQVMAFVLFAACDLCLIGAATKTFLSAGLVLAGGFNPAKVRLGERHTLAELKSAEADAWYAAAEMAMWSGNRKAKDLFGARRLLIAALIAAVVAAPFVLVAQPDDSLEETKLVPAPTPSPGFKVSDDDSVPHAAG